MRQFLIDEYEGVQPWQILQQRHGVAHMALSGRLQIAEDPDNAAGWRPIIRLMREDSGHPAAPHTGWQFAADFERKTGKFRHTLADIPAGGLYRLEIGITPNSKMEGLQILHVVHALGVGDLWAIAGQSNAAGSGTGLSEDPPELGVHILRNDETWALAMHPLNDATGSKHPNIEARPLHSPMLAFAKTLRRELGHPVGLIQTALGGSPLALWDPEEDGLLYRNMLHCIRLAGGDIAGVVWYQGESDADSANLSTYEKRFGQFLERLRRDIGHPDLPFITTQLNRAISPGDDAKDEAWAGMQDLQRRIARDTTGVSIVPAAGLPLSDGIHNSIAGNLELGARYAASALANVYGREVIGRWPEITGAECTGKRRVALYFKNVASRLVVITEHPHDFRISDSDGVIRITGWRIRNRNVLDLILEREPGDDTTISSCYGTAAAPTLYDAETNCPALVFTVHLGSA